MKRLDLSEWHGLHSEAAKEQRAHIDRHRLAIGSRYGEAQRFLGLDPGALRAPPTGWTFVPAAQRAQQLGEPAAMTDDERIEYRAFWAWYGPVESAILDLCDLLAFFAPIADEHREVFEGLCNTAASLAEHYGRLAHEKRIVWMPARLGWGATREKREKLHALEYLAKHRLTFDAQPPAWTSEPDEPRMEMPF